jgi:hypothetical protein
VNKVTLGQAFLRALQFFRVIIVPPMTLSPSYKLLLPEGQRSEAQQPSIKQRCFKNWGALGTKKTLNYLWVELRK